MAKTSVTFDDIAQWLINNPTKEVKGKVVPTSVPDAVKALGYKGGPLKIREGNLTWNRQNLRVSSKGQSSLADSYRTAAQRQTTPDKEIRKLANIKISYINKRGKVADHILTNSALRNGEEYVRMLRGEEGVQEMRRRYSDIGGYGHSKENLQALTPEENQAKELQERKLRGRTSDSTSYLNHLGNKPSIDSPNYAAWEAKRSEYARLIENNFMPTRGGLKFASNVSRIDMAAQTAANLATGNVAGAAVSGSALAATEIAKSQPVQKAAAKIVAKRAGKTAAKLIPGVDVAISAGEVVEYAGKGRLDQAAIAAVSGVVGFIPGIGDAAAAGLDAINTGLDIARLDPNQKPDIESQGGGVRFKPRR